LESVSLQLSQRAERLDDAARKITDILRSFNRYPQGFFFIYESSINDNLDAAHTLIHKLNVPRDTWILDAVKVWIYGEKYRANVQGAAAGGGVVQSSEYTTPDQVTSGSASKVETDTATQTASTSEPSVSETEVSTHKHSFTLYYTTGDEPLIMVQPYNPGGTTHSWIDEGPPPTIERKLMHFSNETETYTGTSTTDAHVHSMPHTHTVTFDLHQHGMDHTHQVPGSSHSHQVTFQNHTHGLNFGIYEAPSATANISLKIIDPDDQETNLGVIGTGIFSKEAWDLTQYFTKIGNYQLVFSADDPARIRSMVFMQPFIQPEGEY